MINVRNEIINWFYPKCCPVCHNILKEKQTWVCPECMHEIQPIHAPYCLKCGKPVDENMEYCPDCECHPGRFDCGRGIFVYNEVWKDSILKFKNGWRREYGDFYAALLCFYAAKDLKTWHPDLIVAVPLTKKKKRLRGFNQAEYIAERISKATGIYYDAKCVRKNKETTQQKTLGRSERLKNLKHAFSVEGNVKGKRILLVDDVYTTGSTMNSLATALRTAGASKVYFLTVCIGGDGQE